MKGFHQQGKGCYLRFQEMSDNEEEQPEFPVLTQNDFSGRLKDIFKILDDTSKKPIVINVDAILPKGDKQLDVFRSILYKMPESVETLSIKFNTLTPESEEFFLSWLAQNEALQKLYIMGSNLGMDENKRDAVLRAWEKNHEYHIAENNGNSLQRRTPDATELEEDA